MMHITPFILIVPVSILMAIYRPKWLVYLLIISLSLQVSSIANIGNYSMQIYRFMTILISILFLIEKVFFNNLKIRFTSKNLKIIFSYGILFSLFIFFYALVGPFIFEGYPVYPPHLGIDFSAIYGPSPLKFSKYNIAFPIYIIFNILTLGYIITTQWKHEDILALQKSLGISIFIVFLTGLSQINFHYFGNFDVTKIFYTITSRKLDYALIGNFLPIPRVQATFMEPSMLAPFIIGIFALYFYNFLNSSSKLISFLISSLSLGIIILSTSTTAYVTLCIVFLIIVFFNKPFKFRNDLRLFIIKSKLKTYTVYSFLFLIILIPFIHFIIGWDNLLKILELYLFNKSESGSFKSRTTADIHALTLFVKTYGLGVGLGSNRPSSLSLYLLSQCGAIGTFMFFYYVFSTLKFTYNALKGTQYFGYFFLLPAELIAQLIAYPDITNPTLWQFIYIATIISIWRTKYETIH